MGTPQTILDRHIAWRGGLEAIRANGSIVRHGRLDMAGMSGSTRLILCLDGRFRMDFDVGVLAGSEAISPDDAWQLDPNGVPEDLEELQRVLNTRALRRHFAYFDDAILERRDDEVVRAREAEVVRLNYPDGNWFELCVDSAGALLATRETKGPLLYRSWPSDWKFHEGVRLPTREWTECVDGPSSTVVWSETESASVAANAFQRPPRPLASFDSGQASWLPTTLWRGRHLFVDGTFQGRSVSILVDSGAAMTVISRDLANSVGLLGEGAIGTPEQPASLVRGVKIALGGTRLPEVNGSVVDTRQLSDTIGRELGVILGGSLFHAAIVDIDYPRSRMALRDPDSFSYQGEGVELPLRYDPAGHWLIEASIDGLPPTFLRADTGSDVPLCLFQDFTDQHEFRRNEPCSVSLGGVMLWGMPTIHAPKESGLASGILGSAVLSRFRCIFDFNAKTLRLERQAVTEILH